MVLGDGEANALDDVLLGWRLRLGLLGAQCQEVEEEGRERGLGRRVEVVDVVAAHDEQHRPQEQLEGVGRPVEVPDAAAPSTSHCGTRGVSPPSVGRKVPQCDGPELPKVLIGKEYVRRVAAAAKSSSCNKRWTCTRSWPGLRTSHYPGKWSQTNFCGPLQSLKCTQKWVPPGVHIP